MFIFHLQHFVIIKIKQYIKTNQNQPQSEMEEQTCSITRKMRQEFTVSIRRQKKQQIFQSYRHQLRNKVLQDEQFRMMQYLDTTEKRQQWIHLKARQLTGIPDESWRYLINELVWSLTCFKGKDSFRVWMQSGIIKNLCTTFHFQYYDLRLAPKAARLLGNIIFFQQYQQPDQIKRTSYIVNEILSHQVLPNIVQLAMDKKFPYTQTSHFITLLMNLALSQFGQVMKQGGFTACVEWSYRMLSEKKMNRIFLQQIYQFFACLVKCQTQINVKYTFSHQLIEVLNQFIQIDQAIPLIMQILEIIYAILKHNRQPIIKTVLDFKPLMAKIFQFAIHENQIVRQNSWLILSYLSSSNYDVSEMFQKFNFVDLMITAYEKQPRDNNNFDKITMAMLYCIGNIVEQHDRIREIVLKTKLIGIVIDSTHESRSTNLRTSAYYSLYNCLQTQNYQLLKIIIFDLPILQKLVMGLHSMLNISKKCIQDIVAIILHLIKADRKVLRYEEGVLQVLQSRFQLEKSLSLVMDKYHKDAKISMNINQIYDLYSN